MAEMSTNFVKLRYDGYAMTNRLVVYDFQCPMHFAKLVTVASSVF